MSQQNKEIILATQYKEGLAELTDELLQHEIDYCLAQLQFGTLLEHDKYAQWHKDRLRLAEDEAERRFLSRS